MIFTNCTNCNNSIIVYYEAGDEGAGGAEKVKCEECDAINFVELVSIDGETLSEKEFWERHPNARKNND